jgi:hypothetical protein
MRPVAQQGAAPPCEFHSRRSAMALPLGSREEGQQDLAIQECADPDNNPMIPHTLVLAPGLVIYKIYNGYWFWGRPWFYVDPRGTAGSPPQPSSPRSRPRLSTWTSGTRVSARDRRPHQRWNCGGAAAASGGCLATRSGPAARSRGGERRPEPLPRKRRFGGQTPGNRLQPGSIPGGLASRVLSQKNLQIAV